MYQYFPKNTIDYTSISVIFGFIFSIYLLEKAWRKNLKPYKITYSDTELRLETEFFSSEIKKISSLRIDEASLYLMTSQGQYIVAPRRIFENQEEIEKILAMANSLLKKD